jgi:hypothetical protein
MLARWGMKYSRSVGMLNCGILKRKRHETEGAEARIATRRKDGGEAEESRDKQQAWLTQFEEDRREEQQPVFRIASRRRKEPGISGKTPSSTLTKSRSFREKELTIINVNNKNLEHEIKAQELNPHSRIYFLLSKGNFLRDHFDATTQATNNNALTDSSGG